MESVHHESVWGLLSRVWLVAAVFGGERVKNFSPKKVHAEKGGHVGENKWEEVEGKCLLVRG